MDCQLLHIGLSGAVTALMVIAINEGIQWFRRRRQRRGILFLLISELTYNQDLLIHHLPDVRRGKLSMQFKVWEAVCRDIPFLVPEKYVIELSTVYFMLRQMELGTSHVREKSHLFERIERLKVQVLEMSRKIHP